MRFHDPGTAARRRGRSRRSSILPVALFVAAHVLAGCSDRKQPAGDKASKAAPKKAKGAAGAAAAAFSGGAPIARADLFKRVPQGAEFAVAIADLPAAYRLFGSLEGAVTRTELGSRMVARARRLTRATPVPVPWKLAQLRALGIDEGGVVLVMRHRGATSVRFGLKDAAEFKKKMSGLGKDGWGEQEHDGLKLSLLRTAAGQTLSCYLGGGLGLCSTDRAAVVRQIKEKVSRPVWDRLSAVQRGQATAATALFWTQKSKNAFLITSKVEGDGLSVQGDFTIPSLARAGTLRGVADNDPSASKLLGLGKGAGSLLYALVPRVVLKQLLSRLPMKKQKIDPVSQLTGEVLALEGKPDELALVLGATSQGAAQQVVDALVFTLARSVKRWGKKAPPIKILGKKNNGRMAYKIQIKADRQRLPVDLDIGVAAGHLGVVVGTMPAVDRLAAVPKADPKAVIRSLATPEERAALGKGAFLALRMHMGDPLGPFGQNLEQLMPAEMGAKIIGAISLGRFLVNQLHGVTLGQTFEAPDRVRLVLRVTTMHRDGNAGDDRAREIWRKGILDRYAGNQGGYDSAVRKLSADHAGSRYARVKRKEQATLLTMITGVVAAVAIPAFLKYTRRSKTLEAKMNLDRLRRAAARTYESDPPSSTGKVSLRSFPRGDTGWTPGKPCCKQPARYCAAPGAWKHEIWKALRFDLPRRHHYQYRFVGKGKGKKSTCVIEARGDLDCDGTFSSFKIEGAILNEKVTFARPQVEDPLE